jgi:hypothetical protein
MMSSGFEQSTFAPIDDEVVNNIARGIAIRARGWWNEVRVQYYL